MTMKNSDKIFQKRIFMNENKYGEVDNFVLMIYFLKNVPVHYTTAYYKTLSWTAEIYDVMKLSKTKHNSVIGNLYRVRTNFWNFYFQFDTISTMIQSWAVAINDIMKRSPLG